MAGARPAGLRARVLAAARREWAVPRVPSARRDFGRFAAATAAAVLLAINLSASVANDTDWHLRAAADESAAAADRIRELAPDLPEREARRQALLLRAAAGLAPAPVPAPPTDRALWTKEPERWDRR